jgi:hypothetical protein
MLTLLAAACSRPPDPGGCGVFEPPPHVPTLLPLPWHFDWTVTPALPSGGGAYDPRLAGATWTQFVPDAGALTITYDLSGRAVRVNVVDCWLEDIVWDDDGCAVEDTISLFDGCDVPPDVLHATCDAHGQPVSVDGAFGTTTYDNVYAADRLVSYAGDDGSSGSLEWDGDRMVSDTLVRYEGADPEETRWTWEGDRVVALDRGSGHTDYSYDDRGRAVRSIGSDDYGVRTGETEYLYLGLHDLLPSRAVTEFADGTTQTLLYDVSCAD